ncbi:MAG: phage holin family protein [Armatimonadota bacterium]|nr:phage holin family protein [Armatimonadota bacterium]
MPRYEGMTGLVMLGLALMIIGGLIAGTCTLGGFVNFARWGDSSLALVATLGYITLFAGMLIIGGVAAYGLWKHRKRFEGPQRTIENAYVIACTALDKQTGETIYYWRDYPDPMVFYVRLQEPDGRQNEYETAREVFETVMEGARGTAVCQGQWLCSFQAHWGATPHIARPEREPLPRDAESR